MKAVAICLFVFVAVAFAEPQNMPISVVSGGASQAVNNLGHRVHGSVGQVLASRQLSVTETLHSGFWPSRNAAAPLPIERIETVLPTEIEFHPAFPNPFNPVTQLSFSLPKAADVQLTLFDITGREVTTLVNENFQAGTHHLNWNAESFASGTYFARLKTAGKTLTQKLQLLK